MGGGDKQQMLNVWKKTFKKMSFSLGVEEERQIKLNHQRPDERQRGIDGGNTLGNIVDKIGVGKEYRKGPSCCTDIRVAQRGEEKRR